MLHLPAVMGNVIVCVGNLGYYKVGKHNIYRCKGLI